MKCPRCEHENLAKASFCGECGDRLELICPTCRAANPSGNRFCLECGEAFTESRSSESPRGPVERLASPRAYTPRHLADRILTSRSALEGERKQVTVLFADVENFTGIAEQLDPEDLHLLLDRVFAILLEVIHRYEGTINQFTGDGVMALFGAPIALEDHALRSVEAALEIQDSMVAAADEFQAQFGITPRLRVGLNTGRVVVGKIGDDLRMDYTAQGDTVNLASRLQTLAEPGTVAISAATQRLVEDDVECVALGSHSIKGKTAPVDVFKPIRAVGPGARPAMSSDQPTSPFVGRDAQLGRLLVLFQEVRSGQSRVVTVVGEAGIGKSRLLLEFKNRIGQLHMSWFVGRCVPYGRSTPYRPIVEILRSMLGLEGDDSADVARAKLEMRLIELGDHERKLSPALRSLLSIGEPDAGLSLLSPAERKAAITRGIDGVLMAPTMRDPHVFVLEGGQWLDSASEEYILHVLQQGLSGPVLLILTSRPGEAGHPALTAGERISLEALTSSETWSLVTPMATDELSVDLLTSTVERTGGNPLFIEEVVRGLVETGSETIPATVEDVLMARVDRLLPPLKATLRTASVIGQEFGRLPLERVVDSPAALAPALGDLLGMGLITEAEPETAACRFKQPLLQEVAYGGLLNRYRKVTHHAIGKAFEELYPNRLSEHFEELARHFTLAEEWPAALLYHREAGRKAAALCANAEAADRFQQALELLDRLPESPERTGQAIDIRLELCPPMFQLGRLDDVLRLTTEAEALAQQLGDERRLSRVYSYLCNIHYMKGQPDRAVDFGQRCLSIEDVTGTAKAEGNVRQYLGTSSHVKGQYRAAEEVLTRHIEVLDAEDDFRRVGKANLSYVSSCGWLAFTHAELGEFPRAHEWTAKGMHAASFASHAYVEAIASTFAGLVWQAQGEIDRALPLLEGALDACRTNQLVMWKPVPSALLGQAYVTVGQVDAGLELLREAVSLTDELGVYAYRSRWEVQLAEGLLAAGQVTRAFETAQSALDLAVRHKEKGNHARALHILGRAALRAGPSEFDRARQYLRQAIDEAERLHLRPLLAQCYSSLAQLAHEQGASRKARESLVMAQTLASELDMKLWSEAAGTGATGENLRSDTGTQDGTLQAGQ